MGQPLVELVDVGVAFGPVPVLTGISLRLEVGEVLGIAGPNGAGKTTLVTVAATLLAPTSGSGAVLGAPLGTPRVRSVRPRIGWSGHDAGLYPELTLSENLHLWADVAGIPRSAADDALEAVGLAGAADRRAGRSSNGMRRRVDLARLLITAPQLVLLDEAHAGLDEDAEAIVDEIIRRVLAREGAALLVSHDAERLARRTASVRRLTAGVLAA